MHTARPTFPASIPLAITRTQQLLLALALVTLVSLWQGGPYLTMRFFREQDLPVALVFLLVFAVWKLLMAGKGPVDRLAALAYRVERLSPAWPAVFTVVAGTAGSWIVFGLYPLSMDEFWAVAGGEIIASGSPMGRLPEEWTPYAEGLQPIFSRIVAEGYWMSHYLPVNSLLQLLLGPLASPLLAGGAVLVTADLARRLMLGRGSAPVVCALLMVTSSQLLLTAMTPYAMSAHLAFNMGWVWLFLRPSRSAQGAAVFVSFLATGLHQFVFFPLFAAPFVAEAFLDGRRTKAAFHAAVIGAGMLFWIGWEAMVYAWLGVTPPFAEGAGTALLAEKLRHLLSQVGPASFGLMALNLIRFATWQNVLILPLVLLMLPWAMKVGGTWRALLGGMALTLVLVTIIIPYQGHGWGYRYLHGMLGNVCLLATMGWYRLVDGAAAGEARPLRAVFASALLISTVLMPVRGVMAAQFTAPWREADAAIGRSKADVVLIDAPSHAFTDDLVRNDPLLRTGPRRIAPHELEPGQLAQLCLNHETAVFSDADAAQFDIPDLGRPQRSETALPEPCAQPLKGRSDRFDRPRLTPN